MKIIWTVNMSSSSGAVPQALVISKGLQKRGHEVILLSVPPLDVKIVEPIVESEFEGLRIVYPTRTVAEAVEAVNPDIVVCHTLHPSVLNDLPRMKGNYPIITRVGINLMELMALSNYEVITPSVARFLRDVDHLICASRNTLNQMKGIGVPDSQMTYIPTVIDPSDFTPTLCEDPTILMMGRVSTIKNHLTAIQAYKLVKEVVPDAELAIAGKGKDTQKILDTIMRDMGLTDYHFFGYYEDLNALFHEVSVLILPSISENMPQAILEAYAAGLPCVISDCGWGETFHNCLKAPHDNPKAIADNVIKLLTDRNFWMETRENQFKELRRFDLEKALDAYEELFQKHAEIESYFASQEEDVQKRLKELGVRVA